MGEARTLTLTAIPDMPEVKPGDDLVELIATAIDENKLTVQDNDILVIAQK